MKIPIKYGLLATAGFIAWVLLTHLLVSNPQSPIHTFGSLIFFNILNFVMIYLGIKAFEREQGERPRFKDGLKTGVSIAFVYGLTASLFFALVLLLTGTRWLGSEPGAANTPIQTLAAKAFAGLFFGTLIPGVVYSTVIAFFLAKRRSDET
jgi:hypothetical protein